jgi:ribosomal protein S18 acetylase RimI-like enzyme
MESELIIREMVEEDCMTISRAFTKQGWNKPVSQYLAYFQESQAGKRLVLLAEYEGQFAGYITIVWESPYPPFKEAGIPDIMDYNVLIRFQRKHIGTALMDEAEKHISQKSTVAGLGVGLMADYGPAQILYVRRGYVPDGRGLSRNEKFLNYGDQTVVDDDLVICLTRQLVQ